MKTHDSTRPNTAGPHRRGAADNGLDNAVSAQDLGAYLDGELPMAKRHTLELRLATDAEIRSRLAALVHVRALVRLAYDMEHER
jgi:anti-sigma factor RsiW